MYEVEGLVEWEVLPSVSWVPSVSVSIMIPFVFGGRDDGYVCGGTGWLGMPKNRYGVLVQSCAPKPVLAEAEADVEDESAADPRLSESAAGGGRVDEG